MSRSEDQFGQSWQNETRPKPRTRNIRSVENPSNPNPSDDQALAGWCVVSFEARMNSETRRLFERHSATVLSAPALQEVPLNDQKSALQLGEHLMRGDVDMLVLLTGVGTRILIEVLCLRWEKPEVLAALAKTQLVCRGPKPVAALKAFGLRPSVVVPEPNTWRDIVSTFEREALGRGRRIWVQEYGRPNLELVQALSVQAASVGTVTVYGWSLPDDLEPLKAAVAAMIAGTARLACFTTGVQVDHLFEVANRLTLDKALHQAMLERIVIASIGPLTTERLSKCGIEVDIEPEHPKLGHLIQAIARQARDAWLNKRGTALF